MEIKEIHIVPAGCVWEAREASGKIHKTILRNPSKRDLVVKTIDLAKKDRLTKVVVHNNDGSIEKEEKYGKELSEFPFPGFFNSADEYFKQN